MRRAALILTTLGLAGGTTIAATAGEHVPRSPRINYMTNCQGCHLPDGRGMEGKVPAMRGFLANFLLVPGGRDYLIRVPGVANSTLSDADLAALLNWLVPAMGPSIEIEFKPYSPAEIGALRKRRLQDVNSIRAALIAQMPEARRTPTPHQAR